MDGKLNHVDHFDSKAIVEEYAEANTGDTVVSHFMPGKSVPISLLKHALDAGDDD